MQTERPIDPNIKNMLLANTPFQYAHLVKFERPSRPDNSSGQVSTASNRYTYITDASRDVDFNDGSTDQLGNANGTQTYIANKVIKVSSVSEDTAAKASSYTLTLDGNGLGALLTSNATITVVTTNQVWDISWPVGTHLTKYGFREGDKVVLSGIATGAFNIVNFTAHNSVRVKRIDTTMSAFSGSLTMALASEEIISILLDKNSSDYSSFINREIFIYRAYFQNGTQVGTPFLLFKGIIAAVSFDDGDAALTVAWTLTSHWGDFEQVKGRITSDDFHRALDQNGVPQPGSALKVEYAYDKGFMHAETSVHLLSTYKVAVQKEDVKVKSGFLGIGSKVKVKKYIAYEDHQTNLDFQLQAKSIPVIYGVRVTPGLPVFADTLNDDTTTVYIAQALSEGEIGGIYDVYIDGNSLICNDFDDYTARSVQTTDNTVKLICRGRSDRGDVLGGISSVSNTYQDFYNTYYSNSTQQYQSTLNYDLNYQYAYPSYIAPTTATTDYTGAGVSDGQSINLSDPQNITLDVFSGKAGQKAAASLVAVAKTNNFKLQNTYWNGISTADYWGPNHRLLDTAYVVGKFIIADGETTIPDISFVVRGKVINCYNYDKSYTHYEKATSESAGNFLLGDTVALKAMDGSTLVGSCQIIDKWTFANADSSPNTRFRFSVDPPLTYVNGIPLTTKFQMVSSAGATWTMITYNYKETEGVNATEFLIPITGTSNNGGFVQFTFSSQANITTGGDPVESSSVFSVVDANGIPIDNYYFGNAALVGTLTTTSLTTKYSYGSAGDFASQTIGSYLVRRNVVLLPSGSSTMTDYYNGGKVTLTRVDPTTGRKNVQTKDIIDYDGPTRIATIEGMWNYGYHPKAGDTITITPPRTDSRISINPAMQLMDYICSPTYGRNLDPHVDLNFQSWLDTALLCDKQSDVTILFQSGTMPNHGDVYRYPATGPILWQGTVVGVDGLYVQFTNVIGKISNKWKNWRTYKVNEIVYDEDRLYRVDTAGAKPNEPIHASGSTQGMTYTTNVPVTKVSGGGPTTLIASNGGNFVKAQKDGSIIPGYSLYDSDGVDYWRLLGWDEFSQRYVTQHQTNLIVDTSLPLFDNVNSFLDHFNAIMRYNNGQYYLDLEQPADPISEIDSEARNITADHIIGKIRLTDEGIKNAFNSLTTGYPDPANKFESRNISFFNSDYLKSDRGVPKKGNLTVPGITNYYNTRILADRFLNKSRFGLVVQFNMAPRGLLLLAGMVIQLQYPRYGWVDKKFRISSLVHQEDATVDIVAQEYDDSFYSLSKISKQAAAGLSGGSAIITAIGSPTGLRATGLASNDEQVSGVAVSWVNNAAANDKNVFTELYSSYSSHLYIGISSISGNVLTTVEPNHELHAGELIKCLDSINGLQADTSYFIAQIVGPNQFTISLTKGGPIVGLNDGTGIMAEMQAASLIGTIACPANSFVDVFGGIDGRIVKYYWVRHKVVQGN